MKYFWLSFKAIFVKDIVTELRTKQTLPTMIVLGMLIVWILHIVSEIVSAQAIVMGPAALWIAFLFSGILAQERSFATEQQRGPQVDRFVGIVSIASMHCTVMLQSVSSASYPKASALTSARSGATPELHAHHGPSVSNKK